MTPDRATRSSAGPLARNVTCARGATHEARGAMPSTIERETSQLRRDGRAPSMRSRLRSQPADHVAWLVESSAVSAPRANSTKARWS